MSKERTSFEPENITAVRLQRYMYLETFGIPSMVTMEPGGNSEGRLINIPSLLRGAKSTYAKCKHHRRMKKVWGRQKITEKKAVKVQRSRNQEETRRGGEKMSWAERALRSWKKKMLKSPLQKLNITTLWRDFIKGNWEEAFRCRSLIIIWRKYVKMSLISSAATTCDHALAITHRTSMHHWRLRSISTFSASCFIVLPVESRATFVDFDGSYEFTVLSSPD